MLNNKHTFKNIASAFAIVMSLTIALNLTAAEYFKCGGIKTRPSASNDTPPYGRPSAENDTPPYGRK